MNYVISDIHGHYDKYKEMLGKIGFNDYDTLYILGDVLDRGPEGIKVLQDMMMRPNVIPVLGNHEYMAMLSLSWMMKEVTEDTLEEFDVDKMQSLSEWMLVGGKETMAEFQKLCAEDREDILEYLTEFSLYEVVHAGGETFILVHAGLNNFQPDRDMYEYDLSELIFQKPDYDKEYFQDKYLVTGHTPTRVINGVDKIFVKNRHIAIDCGCEFGGKLGCICLDSMEQFYV